LSTRAREKKIRGEGKEGEKAKNRGKLLRLHGETWIKKECRKKKSGVKVACDSKGEEKRPKTPGVRARLRKPPGRNETGSGGGGVSKAIPTSRDLVGGGDKKQKCRKL